MRSNIISDNTPLMFKILRFKGVGDTFWFSADWHAYHNPVHWENPIWKMRGYSSVQEMTSNIIINTNKSVKVTDTMFFLGDGFLNATEETVNSFFDQIHCQNIYYIWGNHESIPLFIYKRELRNQYGVDGIEIYPIKYKNVIFVGNVMNINVNGQAICMTHFAPRIWDRSHHGVWSLSGHSHGSDKERLQQHKNGKSLDVGWDTKLAPYSFTDLQRIMSTKTVQQLDHHNETII